MLYKFKYYEEDDQYIGLARKNEVKMKVYQCNDLESYDMPSVFDIQSRVLVGPSLASTGASVIVRNTHWMECDKKFII